MIDISQLSRPELLDLQKKIEVRLKEAEVQALDDAKAKVAELAKGMNMTVQQMLAATGLDGMIGLKARAGKARADTGKKVEPVYHNPDNHAEQWSGRGRQPQWVKGQLATGKSMDELRIAR
jgi:DNA-binding protein H-NS